MTKRKLPLLTAQALHGVKAHQTELEHQFRTGVETSDLDVTCRKKCVHCCHHPISISVLEGALLFLWLEKNRKWTSTLKRQLEKHSTQVMGLPTETWMLMSIPCPLLEDGLCRAYKARPFTCRTIFSSGVPDLCKPEQFTTRTPIIPRLPELATFQEKEKSYHDGSAYYTIPISSAILLGERLARGTLEVSGIGPAILARYLEAYQ